MPNKTKTTKTNTIKCTRNIGGNGGGDGRRQHQSSKCLSLLLTVFDYLMSFIVLAPLCVLFWRGTWQYIDCENASITLPAYVGPLISAVFGHFTCFLFTLFQKPIGNFLGINIDSSVKNERLEKPNGNWWLFGFRLVFSRLYTAIYALALVNQWRGVWLTLELCVGKSWQSGAAVAITGTILLAATRTLRNVMAPPLNVAPDLLDLNFVRSPTIFGLASLQKRKGALCAASVDALVSVVFVSSLVVFVWRGVWTVLDELLYVGTPKTSALCSLILGYTVVTVACTLQRSAAAVSASFQSNLARICFEDFFIFSASLGVVNVWRGVWILADVYVYRDDYKFSNLLTSVVGLGTSMLLFAGSNVLARGVAIDGQLKDGSGCLFDNSYLRKIFKKSRTTTWELSSIQEDGFIDPQIKFYKINGGSTPIGSTIQQGQTKDNFSEDMANIQDGKSSGNERTSSEVMVIIERETSF